MQKRIIVTVEKKISKSLFHENKLFTERKFEKCCNAKKMHKGHITGRRNNLYKKKSKLKVWHSYRKNSLNHTSENQKSIFLISYFENCFYMQSLPTANFSLVWPNFCTPYYTCLTSYPMPSPIGELGNLSLRSSFLEISYCATNFTEISYCFTKNFETCF